MPNEKREKLAAYAHETWAGRVQHLFGECVPHYSRGGVQDGLVIPGPLVTRLQRQAYTPYKELPQSKKERDRAEANRILGIVNSSIARDLNWHWTAGEVMFDCPCGVEEIILSEGGDSKQCECGRTYHLMHYVEVEGPEA